MGRGPGLIAPGLRQRTPTVLLFGDRLALLHRRGMKLLAESVDGARFEVELPFGYDMRTKVANYYDKLLILHPDYRPLVYDPKTKVLEPVQLDFPAVG